MATYPCRLDSQPPEFWAANLSAVEIELLFKGTSYESGVKQAVARGDKKIVAHFIERMRTEQPWREAAAKARAALLASDSACLLLDACVRFMLAPACTPDTLREAAQRIEDQLATLK